MSVVGSCPLWAVVMVGSCRGGQLSTVGSCRRWAVVHGGQLSRWAVVTVGSCHGGQLSPVGSCPRWAVVHSGQLSPVGSCHSGQLSLVGSCPRWAVVAGGQLSRGAAVGWGDVAGGSCRVGRCWRILYSSCLYLCKVCLATIILCLARDPLDRKIWLPQLMLDGEYSS